MPNVIAKIKLTADINMRKLVLEDPSVCVVSNDLLANTETKNPI